MSAVAIVMTTYNGEKYVGEQVESILASTYQDFELFIYDDGSKDNTMPILRAYEGKYPSKLHVYQNEENLGVNANFFHALSRTTMDYIMFCDQDDYWKPNKIAITLKRMRHMEGQLGKETPIAVFTDAVVADKELKQIHKSFFGFNHLNPEKTDLPHILMENKLIGCTVMMNGAIRKILQSNRIPRAAKYHDWWIALIASSMGKIGFVNEATMLYRQHGNNVVGGDGFINYVKNRSAAIKEQKKAIIILEKQAGEFLELYKDLIPEKNIKVIETFAKLEQRNYINRRIIILKKGYLKSGFIRNLGLMYII